MAGITKRKNTWYAFWVGNDGKKRMKSTKIKVKAPGKTEKQTERLARNIADAMESAAKGDCLDKAVAAIRSVAEIQGFVKPVPTIEEYLTSFPKQSSQKNEMARQQNFRCFLQWLGKDAKLPITHITAEHIRGHLIWLIQHYRKTSVSRRRQNLACAFNRAVEVDQYIVHSPMKAVKLGQLFKTLGVEDDSVARMPFTVEEMIKILNDFPQPYRDLAAASFYLGGLRLGDVCLLRWDAIDFVQLGVAVREQKTGNPRFIHLLPALRERLLVRKEQQEEGEEYVFPESARKYLNSPGVVSTEFTSLLKAYGIKTREEGKSALKGKRRQTTTKCFHSIRHTVVSWARSNPHLSPDIVRETVGHSSEKIEQHYFTAADEAKREVLETLANMVRPDTDSNATA